MSFRILHILDHSLPLHSGYAFRSDAIRREQESLGWKTYWLTTPKQGDVPGDEEIYDGKRYLRTPDAVGGNYWAQMRATKERIERAVEQVKPDLIQAHSPVLNVIPALWVRRKFGLPVIYERRSSWEDAAATRGTSLAGGPRYQASRFLETIAFRRVDAITTICEGLQDDITVRGIEKQKISLIPNGVDTTAFQVDLPKDESLAKSLGVLDSIVLGYAGSFSPYEGLELLLRAVAKLAGRVSNLKVLLVGSGGNENELRQLALDLKIDDIVVFTGRVEHAEIRQYYSLVDIFVYPRLSTRLTNMVTPLKPLEAMASGRLVLASDVGGHRELIRHQDNGYLFESNSADSLADSIDYLVQNRKLWPETIARARKFVEVERTWANSVKGYASVYGRLVERVDNDSLAKQ